MSGKFGLGKGLADLRAEMGQIPDISILTNVERVVVKQIPIAQIGANPDQPRKTFTETELSELAASIKEKGVLQPILLRTVTGRPYMYEIVAGERRYRASKMAGLSEIPALVKTLNDENATEYTGRFRQSNGRAGRTVGIGGAYNRRGRKSGRIGP